MSDPFLTDDPEEGDLTLDPPARTERVREPRESSTATANVRRTPVSPFRRVVSREIGPAEDVEDIHAMELDPGAQAPAASWDTTDRGVVGRIQNQALPALHRNKMADLLDSVHQANDPRVLEQRVSNALRYSAVGLLALVVVLVLGSMVFFRSKPAGGVVAPAPAPVAGPGEQAVDAQAEVAQAAVALRAFLGASGPADRQRLIDPDEPMPGLFSGPGPVPVLDKVKFSADRARVVQIGPEVAVLLPMIDHSGVERTVALLKRGGSYRVDWRSVMTPEPTAWNEFVAAPAREPRLFRVQLSAAAAAAPPGRLQAHRPTGDPATVAVSVDPQSRVGEDILSALRDRGGKPLAADLFLSGKSDGRLEIVGWTPDKWAF